MAVWSLSAAPLIMGNDLTNVVPSHRAILQNPEVLLPLALSDPYHCPCPASSLALDLAVPSVL